MTWILHKQDSTSYLIISDFDTVQSALKLPSSFSLLGLWSLAGDNVRYANGIVYYDAGTSVFSARNDVFARLFQVPYTALDAIDGVSLHNFLFPGFFLPLSRSIVLYGIMWILVVLVVFL